MKQGKSQPVFGESGAGCTFTNTGSGIIINVPTVPPSQSHPFKVSNKGKDQSGAFKFSVQPGVINNLSPEVYDTTDLMTKLPRPQGSWDFGGSGYSYLYLVCGNSGSPAYTFPDPTPANSGYPMVKAFSSQQTSSDSTAYMLLASAYKDPTTEKVTVWQYVTGSLWGDRIKVGNNVAQYFYAKV
jgi:hypothetical protein